MMARHLSRPILIVLAAGLVLLTSPALVGLAQAQTSPPNIIVVMSDDIGWANIGAHMSLGVPR
jgi:hypothetical protein